MQQEPLFIAQAPPGPSEERIAELMALLDVETHGIKLEIDPVAFEINSPAAIDVEHDEQGNMVGIGVYDGLRAFYFSRLGPQLSGVLCACAGFIAHNGKGDFDCLRGWGIPVSDTQLVWDTMLIGHILDSSLKTYNLKDMARRELGIEYPSYEDIVGRRTEKQSSPRFTLDKWPKEVVARYNAFDTYCTYRLYKRQLSLLY